MSETTEAAEITDAAAVAPAEVPVEIVAAETPAAPEAAPETPAEPASDTKPKTVDRRIANLNRKVAEESRQRENLERELAAARELLAQRQQPDDQRPRDQPPPRVDPNDVDTRARELINQQREDAKRARVIKAGLEQFGNEGWEEKTAILHSLGATNNPAFMGALLETENAPAIVADLADDSDALVELLSQPPTVIATRLGRMDAKLGTPKSPVVSKAPAPAPRVGGTAVVAEFDPYNYPQGMSMREWSAQMDKHLPVRFGGKRKEA